MTDSLRIINQTGSMIKFDMVDYRWYRRLWAVIKVPYDIVRFVVTGKAYFGYFRGGGE